MQVTIAELTKDSEDKGTLNSIIRIELEKSKESSEGNQKLLIEQKSRIQTLEKERRIFEEEASTSKASLELMRKKLNDSMTKTSNSSKEQTTALADYKKNADILIEDLKKQVKDLKEQVQQFTLKESKYEQEIQELKIGINDKTQNSKILTSQLEIQLQKCKAEMKQLTDTLQSKGNAKSAKEEELLIRVNYLEKLNEQLSQSNQNLKNAAEKYEIQIQQLNSKIKKQQITLTSSSVQNEIASNDVDAALFDKEEMLNKQKYQMENLQKELAKLQRQSICASEILQSKEDLVTQIKEIQKQIILKDEEHQKEIQFLKNENMKSINKKSSTDTSDKLKLEILRLKEQSKSDENKIATLESELETIKANKNTEQELEKFKSQVKSLEENVSEIDKKYIEAKISWANVTNENEQISMKINEKIEQNKLYSERVASLEMELLKSKQQLGEALNKLNE